MPLFSLVCLDKPDALALRQATRPDHLAYVDKTGMVRLGGPMLNPETNDPAGSLLVIEAEDFAAAQAFAAADPYAQAGLFASVDIRPFRVVKGEL